MDWLSNPATTDDERRRIRLTRYAVREEVARLALIGFFAALLLWYLFK